MKRVTGIGGIFFKAKNPAALRAWYREHLGIEVHEWGGCPFPWRTDDNPEGNGATIWSVMGADADYFAPSESSFMINYRVGDLHALLAVLRAEGCTVDDKTQESEFGKFGWVMDPEDNRVELWEPPPGQ
jgi:catechol 2,3-dioxygenase-like lactoylglutathione lyase family enzyme